MTRFIRYLCAAVAFITVSGVALNAAAQACPERDVLIQKTLSGGPAGYTPPAFAFTIACGGTPAIPAGFSLTAGAFGVVIPLRTVGAVCTLTETQPAPPAGYTWTSAASATFTMLACPTGAPPQSAQIVTFANVLATAAAPTTAGAGVPTLSSLALCALALLLAALGLSASQRRR